MICEPAFFLQIVQMLLHNPYLRIKDKNATGTAQTTSAWGFGQQIAQSPTAEIPFLMENANARNSSTFSPISSQNGDADSLDAEVYLADLGRLPVNWKGKLASGDDQLQESIADIRLGKKVLHMRKERLETLLQEVQTQRDDFGQGIANAFGLYNSMTGTTGGVSYVFLPIQAIAREFQRLESKLNALLAEVMKALNFFEHCSSLRNVSPCCNLASYSCVEEGQMQHQRLPQHQLGSFPDEEQPWRPQRGLPEGAVQLLRAWLFENFLHPYPKDAEKLHLAQQTGLSRSQVSNWFINARVRLWKPMVEDMYEDNAPQDNSPKATFKGHRLANGNHQLPLPIPPSCSNLLPLSPAMSLGHSEPSQYDFFTKSSAAPEIGNRSRLIRAPPPSLHIDTSSFDRFEHHGGSSNDLSYGWSQQPNLYSPSDPDASAVSAPAFPLASPLAEAFSRFNTGSSFRSSVANSLIPKPIDFPVIGTSLTLGLSEGLRHLDFSTLSGDKDSHEQLLQHTPDEAMGYNAAISPSSSRSVLYNMLSGYNAGSDPLPEETIGRMDAMQLGNTNEAPQTFFPIEQLGAEQDVSGLMQR